MANGMVCGLGGNMVLSGKTLKRLTCFNMLNRGIGGYSLVPCVDECFADKIHPNEYGCLLLAKNLYKIIKKVKF